MDNYTVVCLVTKLWCKPMKRGNVKKVIRRMLQASRIAERICFFLCFRKVQLGVVPVLACNILVSYYYSISGTRLLFQFFLQFIICIRVDLVEHDVCEIRFKQSGHCRWP